MKKKLKTVPKFKTEAEERIFWESHDSTDYIDWSQAKNVRFPNVKPSTQAISLRLPLSLLEKIKVEANRRDVRYQSLIKVWLGEKVETSPPARTRHRPRSNARRAHSTAS
jgi:predicted DNA binding CopG/RHH family protein